MNDLKNNNYSFAFPLQIFSNNRINIFENCGYIPKILEERNIFYHTFNDKRKDLLIRRIKSLRLLPNFLRDQLKKYEIPVNDIISIFVYGSYLYGDVDYKPDDIDAGIIIKGSYFKYIIDQIEVVPPLSNELIVPVQKINVFIYGEDNMAKGVPIEDTVVAGVTHTQATLHELIVAYWRDIVLEGKDFAPIEKNERNIIVTLGREIEYCYARLFKKGNTKEVPNIIFKKISCRMIEVNLFLHFLFPQLQLNWEYLFRLPSRALQSKVSYKEIKTLCDKTLLTYSKLRRKYL